MSPAPIFDMDGHTDVQIRPSIGALTRYRFSEGRVSLRQYFVLFGRWRSVSFNLSLTRAPRPPSIP